MSIFANLTVKKFDGTTDIVWTGISPSAGDGVPAIYRSDTVGPAILFRPEHRFWQTGSANSKIRTHKTSTVFPVFGVDATGGRNKIFGYVTRVTETKCYLEAPDVDVREAVYQANNLETALRIDIINGSAPR